MVSPAPSGINGQNPNINVNLSADFSAKRNPTEFNDVRQVQTLSMAAKMATECDTERAEKILNDHEDKEWHEKFVLLYRMLVTPGYRLSPVTWAMIAGASAYVIFSFYVFRTLSLALMAR